MRASVAFVYLVAMVVASAASANELWERKWIEVRSPHFVIISTVSEKQSVELTQDLERFRTAVRMVTNIGRFEERIPTKVYVLPYAVEELGFTSNLKGYFFPKMRANYAAVIPAVGAEIDDVLKHEYVHFLVHNRDTLSYPKWFNEGFAEVIQTLSARGDRIDYGQPLRLWIDWLDQKNGWMPFDELLEVTNVFNMNDLATQVFYAQSWLLVHYLMLGRPDRDFAADATAFLRQVESGANTSDAFEQSFGIPVSKLHNSLVNYGLHDLRVVSLANQDLPDVPTQVSPVAANVIAGELGLLAWQFGNIEEAKRFWDAALTLNPNNTLALVGLGDYEKRAGRFEAAQAYYEKALALEPQNAYAELDYGEYFLARASAATEPDEVAAYLTEARRHFARSYKLDPNNPETLAMNGWSYLRSGESLDKGRDSLVAAHAMLPSQAEIKLMLAQAYVMLGDEKKARPMLQSLIVWDEAGGAEAANKLLDQMSHPPATNGAETTGVPPAAE